MGTSAAPPSVILGLQHGCAITAHTGGTKKDFHLKALPAKQNSMLGSRLEQVLI